MAIHAIVPLHCTQTSEKEVWSEVLEGTFDECCAAAVNYKVGTPYTAPEGSGIGEIWSDYQSPPLNTALSVSRKEGGLGELSHSYTALLKREMWTLDMAEVGKDIRTWLALQMGDAAAAPELAKIANWQAFKDAGDYERWQNFEYDDSGNVLTGDTLVLAQKMMKGVDSYTIYAPVLTRTTLWASMPTDAGVVGVIDTPSVRDGWEIIGANSLAAWTGLATAWLRTASRSSPNNDGTYSLVEQWTGADEIDGDLYEALGGGA